MNASQVCDSQSELVTEGNQYLTFLLQEEQFGLDILCVQEIKGYSRVTQIPNMPDYIKGAMNLRGSVVPIIDLRRKFQMPIVDYNKFTVVIVVNMGSKIIGLVVDAVSDVLNVDESDIDAPPDFGDGFNTAFIKGMAKVGEDLITLLNIERLLDLDAITVEAN